MGIGWACTTAAAAPLAILWFVATPADQIVAGLLKMLL
jgi:hypothetical protein